LNWKYTLKIPDDCKLSQNAINLIKSLLTDVDNRLGFNGANEIKCHPFFKGVDWDNINSLRVPFVPEVSSDYDTRYFDKFNDDDTIIQKEGINDELKKPVKDKLNKDMNFINFNYRRDVSKKANNYIALEVLENHNINLNKNDFLLENMVPETAALKTSKSGENDLVLSNNLGSKNKNKPSVNKPSGIIFLDNQTKNVTEAYNSNPLSKNNNGKTLQTRNITITPRAREVKGINTENEVCHNSKNKKDYLLSKQKISKNNVIVKTQSNNQTQDRSKKNTKRENNPSDISTPIQKNKVSLNLKNLNIISKSNRTATQTNSSSNIISFELYKQNKTPKCTKDIDLLSKSNCKANNVFFYSYIRLIMYLLTNLSYSRIN